MKVKLWILSALAVLLLCSAPVLAETGGSCGANLTWTLNGDTLTITGTGLMSDFDSVNKPGWYEQRNQIRKIIIQSGVTSIGENAFSGCTAVTEATIPEGVTLIGRYAFENCSGLEYVTIPESVTTIQDHAFTECSGLTSVRIPAAVTSCEHSVFYLCSSLYAIYVSPDNMNYSAVDGVLCSKDGTVLINCPEGKTGIYTAPLGIRIIEDGAFHDCRNLTRVNLREGVTTINEYAFSNCTHLTEIEMPDSLVNINPFAFTFGAYNLTVLCNGGCYAAQWAKENNYDIRLLDMTIENGVLSDYTGYADAVIIPENLGITSVGDYAFENAQVRILVLPSGVTSVGEGAFRSSSLEHVSLPNGLTSIGSTAFMGCVNLKSVNIPDGITSIGSMTFDNCALLRSIAIADSVTVIADDAFAGCASLMTVYCETGSSYAASWARAKGYTVVMADDLDASDFILPAWLDEIGEEAFAGLPMSGVTCPDGLWSIGARAFADCANLRVIVIPYNVSFIASNAFAGCPGGLVIIGAPNSTAAEFAQTYGYAFSSR